MDTVQKLEKLAKFLTSLHQAQITLQSRPDSPVDAYFKGKIDEWANKILGVGSGYEAEFAQMYKYRIEKSRPLAQGFADVTVGEPGDINAKSIQLKSTIQDNHSQVSGMIKAALNQLSGERGEQPRANDRLIVDMAIQNPENTWPGGINTLGTMNYVQFEQVAKQKLLELCNDYRAHVSDKKPGHGLNTATRDKLTDVSKIPLQKLGNIPYSGHPNSTQLVTPVHGQHFSNVDRVIHLTVKIRYHFGFPVISGLNFNSNGDATNKYKFLHLAVFNIVRQGTMLNINLTKTHFFDPELGMTIST